MIRIGRLTRSTEFRQIKSFKVMANFKIGGRRKPLKYDFSDIDFEVDV